MAWVWGFCVLKNSARSARVCADVCVCVCVCMCVDVCGCGCVFVYRVSDVARRQALKDNMALRKLDFDNTQLGDQGVATRKSKRKSQWSRLPACHRCTI